MNDPDWDDKEIVEYRHKAATARGRLGINARLWIKRQSWRFVVGSSMFPKRVIDVVAPSPGLLALSPVFATTAIPIKIEDHGPLFFKQTRVGLRGRTFGVWKFLHLAKRIPSP